MKRNIEISKEKSHISSEYEQLVIIREGQKSGESPKIPCEDIGLVVVDERQTTYSHSALDNLVQNGAGLVICGKNHIPSGILLPLGNHHEIVWRVNSQINVKKPLQKQLWSQIITAKIQGQIKNIKDTKVKSQLEALLLNIKSGDSGNIEAQAAKVYWNNWLNEKFNRDPDGNSPNNLLNYGYAIIRAAVARSIVGAGLSPTLGIYHCNRSNAFCLADDLMEPFRPLVDSEARQIYEGGQKELNQPIKARFLTLLTRQVKINETIGLLSAVLPIYISSLCKCYENQSNKLDIPIIQI